MKVTERTYYMHWPPCVALTKETISAVQSQYGYDENYTSIPHDYHDRSVEGWHAILIKFLRYRHLRKIDGPSYPPDPECCSVQDRKINVIYCTSSAVESDHDGNQGLATEGASKSLPHA